MTGALRALTFCLAGALSAQAEPRLQWMPGGERGERVTVEVSGLESDALAAARGWPADKMRGLLSARVQQDGAPAMLGTWQLDAGVLRFTPKFPLTPGVAYRAEFDPSHVPGAGAGRLTADFIMPVPPRGPATVVRQIYPSADEVPENLLKFYLHFSAPMSRGNIYDHIHLRDDAGKEVELPFLQIDEELWDPEMKRLTLFIDPGRIKREVRPLVEVGPALHAGRRFTLAIDPAWLDAAGHPLAARHERTFHVGPADRAPIEPAEWKVTAPGAGRTAPLQVTFTEPLDHALALRLLRVSRADGAAVAGASALSDHERRWSFTPAEAWQPGAHELIVPSILEDLAGNNVGKAFEVELLERGERVQISPAHRIRFEVK